MSSTSAPRTAKLLSPAGSPEAGYAALQFGADAIYCGLRSFSARAEAINFSTDELRSIVHYAHACPRPREVFVAINTLMADSECSDVADAIATIAEAGADALIVQDMGVARLARQIAPALELHASTQMAIHNLEGARAVARWGFRQVTLARELTFNEIRQIAATGLATEVFIHGALCYSYSGLCLMSAMRNARSGNRGRCAYPCRERYVADSLHAHGLAFSMKDLALEHDVLQLVAAGVACLKIEGRMKNATYVAAVTDFYRRILDGDLSSATEREHARHDLQTVFSRPWTTLHAHGIHHTGVIDPAITGHRGVRIGTLSAIHTRTDGSRWLHFQTHRRLEVHDGIQIDLPSEDRPFGFPIERIDCLSQHRRACFECPAGETVAIPLPADAPHIPPGAPLYCASSQTVKQRFTVPLPSSADRKPRTPIDLCLTVSAAAILLQASPTSGYPSVQIQRTDAYTPARTPEKNHQSIIDACGKLGETDFVLHALEIINPDHRFIPLSQLNELRRQTCAALTDALVAESQHRHQHAQTFALPPPHQRPHADIREHWSVKTDQPECLAQLEGVDEAILDLLPEVSDAAIAQCAQHFGQPNIRLALPTIVREWEIAPLRHRIATLSAQGFHRWLAPNPSAFDLLPDGDDIHADWTLYAWNSIAIAEWLARGASSVTLSPECPSDLPVPPLWQWGDLATTVLYQDTPLMISEACPISALGTTCGQCPSHTDRYVPVVLRPQRREGDALLATTRQCRTFITNEVPYDISAYLAHLRRNGGYRWRIDLCLRPYSAEEAASLWGTLRHG